MLFLQTFFETLVIFMFLENIELIDLKSNWKNIQKKTKNIIVESRNKMQGISQIGPKPGSYLDYPGLDIERLNANMKLWDLYYKCLEELPKNINENNIFQARVITTFRSSSLSLECELCISPNDLNDKNVWFYSWLGNPKNLSLIEENDYFRVSSLDLSLTIINIDESKSGFYQCKSSNTQAGPYFIELLKDNDQVIDMNNTKWNYTRNTTLENLNLKIGDLWTQWSSCSKCDTIGKQSKYGHCWVSLKDSTYSEGNTLNSTKQIIKDHKHEEIHFFKSLMDAFDTGLPCQSSLLNLFYITSYIIQNSETKILVQSCKIKCNNDEIFEVRDVQGNIKEKINNSAGMYSPLQIIPEPTPKIETLLLTTFLNEKLYITCPGNLNSDAPYEWKLNNTIILSINERITVDILNRLVFKYVTKNDEQIFTCWQVDYLAGIVQIKIIKKFEISIQDDIYLVGVFLVLGILLWIGFKIYIDREATYYS